ncbi:hypothetical protein DPMN_156643 [Dreissena polymorpha]|uniref:Uncharacterized protein n=1 Tax=Dreissena polymorpha TaxID=45954 RepID=A0A9D4FQ73_DREPO|nr:hypothetical protein DPMN_156643 [Dreissena polymorpha]
MSKWGIPHSVTGNSRPRLGSLSLSSQYIVTMRNTRSKALDPICRDKQNQTLALDRSSSPALYAIKHANEQPASAVTNNIAIPRWIPTDILKIVPEPTMTN